jgi:hypothetical protein
MSCRGAVFGDEASLGWPIYGLDNGNIHLLDRQG